jgi:hypothetical protein
MAFKTTDIVIKAPNLRIMELEIEGTAPYVQHKWTRKALAQMREKQAAGDKAKARRAKEPKDFDALYAESTYRLPDGSYGIPAPSFRNAMISACRTIGLAMTRAKLAVFALADGYDRDDRTTPLVRFTRGEPSKLEMPARNESGVCDIRVRPMWEPGWRAVVRLRFDADMLDEADVVNLLARAGAQVGIGEGRPDGKNSAGLGWGLFQIVP